MLVMAAGAVAGAVVLALMPIEPESAGAVLAMLAWTGGLINAVQTTMYALAAHIYPTAVRATGVGTAVAVGRIGGVLSPSAGSWALDSGGSSRYFGLIAAAMVMAFVALSAIRRHIPGATLQSGAARAFRRAARLGWKASLPPSISRPACAADPTYNVISRYRRRDRRAP
jgi:AAHS family 4-hydroxybenzoate transporter-like MFS transporter